MENLAYKKWGDVRGLGGPEDFGTDLESTYSRHLRQHLEETTQQLAKARLRLAEMQKHYASLKTNEALVPTLYLKFYTLAVQFVSLVIFFICALSLPAWWAFGILMINPLLAIIGLLSASTFWMMGWIAKRQIKQKTLPSNE